MSGDFIVSTLSFEKGNEELGVMGLFAFITHAPHYHVCHVIIIYVGLINITITSASVFCISLFYDLYYYYFNWTSTLD